MGLKMVSSDNKIKEDISLMEIYNSINSNKSLIFNSGAGAGKTYSLVESLKYILSNYGEKLKRNNQNIVCITYTNIASNEIKERIGNNELIVVSTIHVRVWEIIKEFQKELVEIHNIKLQTEMETIINKLNDDFSFFSSLSLDERDKFISIMIKEKETFFRVYYSKASVVKTTFKEILCDFPNCLKNVGKFQKAVSYIYKLDNYQKCTVNISLRKQNFKNIVYNANSNKDRLHKMQISHDTLLDYGLQLIKKYDLLKQIIIDKFPFIFIDEFQDTNPKVVRIMRMLDQYAKEINHDMLIAYFGDSAQNIYEDGVGGKLTELHYGLNIIKKKFNRRSTKEIIDVTNRIRNDEIKQISIYDDCHGGSTKFYTGNSTDIKSFIIKYMQEWRITEKNPLDCLVLTNKTVAEFSGFNNVYLAFKDTDKYKKYDFDLLNTEFLSKDTTKLGEIPKFIFNFIKLRNDLKSQDTPLINFKISSQNKLFDKMNVKELQELIRKLKKISGKTLKDYVKSICWIYKNEENDAFKNTIHLVAETEDFSLDYFKNHIFKSLFPSILDDDEYQNADEAIERLLNINLDEYDLWYKYLVETQKQSVRYHTYHGTKGLEFENVIIIMENKFGKDKQFFDFFFKNLNNNEIDDEIDLRKIERIRNLLYVSCSRAIRNLRVYYTDEVVDFEKGIKHIFNDIYEA